MRLYRLICTNF